MALIHVRSELVYAVAERSTFQFAVTAASQGRQHVLAESLELDPPLEHRRHTVGAPGHDLVVLTSAPGELVLRYAADVELAPLLPTTQPRVEVALADVPADVVGFLQPSRYCESDRLGRFASRLFGGLPPGFERVAGICNWIFEHLAYTPGSTGPSTTAVDVLVQATGVCRDYAHLAIAFCRAMGIPARYVSGYAVDLFPPDFHGFFEAYLDGRWYLFDATRLAPLDGLVRIATGRDAADVPFATFVGSAGLVSMVVEATREGHGGVLPDIVSTG